MSDKPYENTEFMGCACHSPEHVMQLMLWTEEPKMLCIYMCLNPEVWYKRIWLAIKYIFGYKSRFGHFDEFMIKPEDANRLIEMLNKIKE